MIRFSRREDYAVILITKLAQNYNKRLVPLTEVSKEYNISILFLRNLASDLRNSGIIKAVEGKNGGYFLQKDPKKLLMKDVLSAFSKEPLLECCPAGITHKGICPKSGFCQPGFIWRRLNKDFIEKISNLSIDQFMKYE
ncbi:MAG: hypothetical protein A3F31_03855 [Candidatus Levybacteria bacterium RIFCSPHIGHO2_12_FULL_38_12]|nr:MAG: hypothetical protein A2770_02245 [Candidatus Levybacteria bacterium RIFCSPHIGHO2_01_FULL_38_12]OGH21899.1 MAG: hypothetical protein A3D75_00465 [Candidatus Levybacteria bacterium RIFCSPHIGHO2_02_FULL_37_18]OGH22831.1 MAG: hypothetical protein A3F31_03855 [Candidatus Levybacteria bacterium RIFCSPHIGHO2_12_FULL_38_12]OGH33556.1 MAG: hypothetical protein A3A47_01810 [Candidatus Levybacteria bacterium RIFCSPLOWO2_01_FULL_37_20]OGH44477.1 MAG: hypothetical protein A3J14_03500 [Candidatus Lev